MRYVHVDSVEPGQYLGKTIFSGNGAILLSEGVQLTVYMINTLKRIGVTMIYIKDPHMGDVEIVDVVSDETKRAIMNQMIETFSSLRSGKEFNTRSISISVDAFIDELLTNKDVLIQLTDIRSQDNSSYIHSMNVCMMATMIGIHMEMQHSQLKELAIGALLHDIGKIELITNDSDKDVKMHHTWRGFEILKNKREFSLLIAHVAFQHHERMDGEGMPRKLSSDQIHLYARITAIANLYDNLLFDLSQERRMLPHEACEHLMALAGTMIDHRVLIEFLKTVSVYPTGVSVRLTTKEIGVVVGQHKGLPGRPVVRVVKQDTKEDLQVKEIDLAKHTTVFIEQVLS